MSRFVNLEETDIEQLIESKDAKNTKRTISNARKIFLDFAANRGKKEEDLRRMTANELDDILYAFFPSIRKKDGDLMKLTTLKTIRYGISVYLKTELGLDLYSTEFEKSKRSYDAMATDLKKKVGKFVLNHVQ